MFSLTLVREWCGMWNVDTECWPGYETIHTNRNRTGINGGILTLALQCRCRKIPNYNLQFILFNYLYTLT